ncbi:MAG TPA: NADH-quinone oxidoreductase subunit F, partial [Candidatus Latescibacteria bacterium]|nr:NADH-quinone oxidoreductase subunit F [Candidatus Latescibacterota bacterium]
MQERRWLVEGVERPDADALDVYRRNGGYDGAWRAFDEIDPAAVIDEVEAAGLRGHGGAWRPVAARWRAAGALRGVRALLVDVSESESGRFRDRKLAERLPHRLIEGALIAAHALTADDVYLCVRADWRRARSVLEHAMDEARAAGWIDR